MREALVKAAVFWLQVLSGLKWAAGRAGSKIGPRCGPRYGAVSFCGNKNGLQKGAVGGLRQRVGARLLNALACGKPRKLSGAGPTVSLDSCRRSAESCNWQGPACVAAICKPLRGPRWPLVGRPAMLLWQQRALECAAGPQFAVGHSRTSRYSGRYSSRYSSHYSSRYSRREFGSLKRFL